MSYYSKNDDISFQPLTREQEAALFKAYYDRTDEVAARKARDTIISSYLKLVAKLSLAWARGAIPDDEAISAGNYGLLQALESRCFKPSRGYGFGTYLRYYVRGQVMTAIRDRAWKSHAAVVSDDEQESKGPWTKNLAHQRQMEETVDHAYEDQQLLEARKDKLAAAMGRLSPIEADVIKARYFEERQGCEVAKERKLHHTAICKAHNRALRKLKQFLQMHIPEIA